MTALLLRIMLIVAAVCCFCPGSYAEPGNTRHVLTREGAGTDSITASRSLIQHLRHQRLALLSQECDDTAVNGTESFMSSLIGRDLGHDYYVGLTAGRAWRPLKSFGDYDNKLRVYNPVIGVMLKYSF